ncbi:hypothetical protein ACWCXB_28925 [Streptomyces sp. NPDC001514]
MSPMWDAGPEYGEGFCAACGRHTEKGIVTWLPRMSAADVRLIVHANPADCPSASRSSDPSSPEDTSTQEEA